MRELKFHIEIEPYHGVVLTIMDELDFDDLDDYLTEERYVHYDSRSDKGVSSFFFGEGSCKDCIEKIIADFQSSKFYKQ